MFWIVFGIISGILVLLFAALAAASYFIVFYSPKKGQNNDLDLPKEIDYTPYGGTPEAMVRMAMAEPFESVGIVSRDGLKLKGRLYVRHDEGAPVAVCFHGYRGTPARDFSGGLFSLLDSGFNVLAVEQRGHCGSGGHTITFGIKERFDCVDWAKYCVKRFGPDVDILLVGISMGASTVLMAAGEDDLPKNVKLIFADCPFNAPSDIIKTVMRNMGIPAGAVYPAVCVGARIFGGFDLSETTAAKSVSRAKIPAVIVHGEDDNYVPCEMSRIIAEAGPLCERHVFPGADHGVSFMRDRERYEKIMREAAKKCFTLDA